MSKRLLTIGLALPLTAATLVALAPVATASGGGGEVRTSGMCSGTATWKMKAKPDNGRLEVEAEIDSNRVGQTWAVTLKDNGVVIFNGNKVTQAPSGSFEVRKLTANRAVIDHFVLTARHAASGQTCTGTLNI